MKKLIIFCICLINLFSSDLKSFLTTYSKAHNYNLIYSCSFNPYVSFVSLKNFVFSSLNIVSCSIFLQGSTLYVTNLPKKVYIFNLFSITPFQKRNISHFLKSLKISFVWNYNTISIYSNTLQYKNIIYPFLKQFFVSPRDIHIHE